MFHKIATALSISIMLFDGFRTIIYRNVVGTFFELYGQQALAYSLGTISITIAWLISWHTRSSKFTRDDNWPYLLLSNYLVAFIVKTFM